MTLYNKGRFPYQWAISPCRRRGGRLDAADDADRATRGEQQRRTST